MAGKQTLLLLLIPAVGVGHSLPQATSRPLLTVPRRLSPGDGRHWLGAGDARHWLGRRRLLLQLTGRPNPDLLRGQEERGQRQCAEDGGLHGGDSLGDRCVGWWVWRGAGVYPLLRRARAGLGGASVRQV